MFTIFGKKRLSENKLSNIAVNAILDAVDKGFPEIVEIIKNSPELVLDPNLSAEDESLKNQFMLIVVATNLYLLPKFIDSQHDSQLIHKILEKFALVFDVETNDFEKAINDYQNFLKKVNHPSNNMVYAMPKGIFHKFNLADFQEDYFRNMKSPNPLFLKRLDEVMPLFIFDWEEITNKYQLVS